VAELSAHGVEVARLHRYVPSPGDPDFAGEETEFSLRTDGYVGLQRRPWPWPTRSTSRSNITAAGRAPAALRAVRATTSLEWSPRGSHPVPRSASPTL
jgi:hypothetical protein